MRIILSVLLLSLGLWVVSRGIMIPWSVLCGLGIVPLVLPFSLRWGRGISDEGYSPPRPRPPSNPEPYQEQEIFDTGYTGYSDVLPESLPHITTSRGWSNITHENVERMNVNIEKWWIDINRYGGDDERIQVFVADLKSDDTWYASIPLNEVNAFINDKTGMDTDAVRGMYAQG